MLIAKRRWYVSWNPRRVRWKKVSKLSRLTFPALEIQGSRGVADLRLWGCYAIGTGTFCIYYLYMTE